MIRSFLLLAWMTALSVALVSIEPIGTGDSRKPTDNDEVYQFDDRVMPISSRMHTGPDKSACSGMIRLRAYLPSYSTDSYRTILLERLQSICAPGVCVYAIQSNFVEFAPVSPEAFWTTYYPKTSSFGDRGPFDSPETSFPLHNLPATKLTIIMPDVLRKTNDGRKDESRESHFILDDYGFRRRLSHDEVSLRSMIDVWDRLGNDGGRSNDFLRNITFSVIDAISSRPNHGSKFRRRKQAEKRNSADSNVDNDGDDDDDDVRNPRSARQMRRKLVAQVQEALAEQNPHWKLAARGQLSPETELSFSLTASSSEQNNRRVDLELLVLSRIFPLRRLDDPEGQKGQRNRRKEKRLESFVIAKTANIQPGEVVLDPLCKRGTFLVEAAKYWPLGATFVGIDANVGHLEHAKMNADSTFTRLKLLLPSSPSDSVTELVGPNSVHKILSCLPFSKSTSFYRRLLEDWSGALKPDGSMVLVIDQKSLSNLLEAASYCRKPIVGDRDKGVGEERTTPNESDHQQLTVRLVRQSPLQWGTDRALVVLLSMTNATSIDGSATDWSSCPIGLLPWEEQSTNDHRAKGSKDPCSKAWAKIRRETIPPLVPLHQAALTKSGTNRVWLPNGMIYQITHAKLTKQRTIH